ncbi:hypothetical protein NEOLEDRAFT_1043950, partial [Neolentinus lepideus HHB14362 ss-1]
MPRPRSLRSLAISTDTKQNTPKGPPSPTFSDATNASAMNFGLDGPEKIITRANLRASILAYENLMNTCANYRSTLLTMAGATAAFADAMEACAALKGPRYEAGTRFQAASGLHHLVANHWHVLAGTIGEKFEKPLRQHLEDYRNIVAERSASYEKVLHEKSRIIRETEMSNMNKKGRNLQSFREALTVLQRQVDELDELKAQHYQEVMEHEEEVWDVVQGKVSLVVRSTMDVFDRFTSKASDPVIEPMLQSVPDPFDSYGPPTAEDQIFSILPPLSILTTAPPSASPSPMMTTPDIDHGMPTPSTSWTQNGGMYGSTAAPWGDYTSPASPPSSPPRSVSPPSAVPRRQSYPFPTSPGHHPRRSESSRLRSVLSAVEESSHRNGASESSD